MSPAAKTALTVLAVILAGGATIAAVALAKPEVMAIAPLLALVAAALVLRRR